MYRLFYFYFHPLSRGFWGSDKIKRIPDKIPPQDPQELRIFPDPHPTGPRRHNKSQRKTHQEIQEPDPHHSKQHLRQKTGRDIPQSQTIDRQRNIARRNCNMPDIEPRPEYLADKSSHAQKKTQADITDQRPRMLLHIVGQSPQPLLRDRQPQHGMGLQPAADSAIYDLVLDVPGDDTAQKEKDPGITGVQQRKTLPGMLILQHFHGGIPRYELSPHQYV